MFYCFFFTVCSAQNFCIHIDHLIDMRQEKRESEYHLFFATNRYDDPVQHCRDRDGSIREDGSYPYRSGLTPEQC